MFPDWYNRDTEGDETWRLERACACLPQSLLLGSLDAQALNV